MNDAIIFTKRGEENTKNWEKWLQFISLFMQPEIKIHLKNLSRRQECLKFILLQAIIKIMLLYQRVFFFMLKECLWYLRKVQNCFAFCTESFHNLPIPIFCLLLIIVQYFDKYWIHRYTYFSVLSIKCNDSFARYRSSVKFLAVRLKKTKTCCFFQYRYAQFVDT